MAPISDRIQYLLQLYIDRTASQAEVTELFAWIRETGDDELLRQQLWAFWNRQPADEESPAPDFERIYASIRAAMPAGQPAPAKIRKLWPRLAIAASILLLLVTGAFFLFHHPADQPTITAGAERSMNDIPPGDNKAILTLSNGQRILLDSAHTGQLTRQGSARVLKLDSGQLAYNAPETTNNHVLAYNTLTTPRGGQYQLVLSDGTKVWLNAASSITFPTAFAGGERRVEITGEAYFEVAKNRTMPFVVKANRIDVKVLGTHFDVMAYADEAAWKATLLEGMVSVGETGNERARTMLRAGNQALIDPAGAGIKVIADADLELAVAWKNGYTAFKSADIRSIMRQVERWYDMNVRYEGFIPHRAFTGKIPRSANLSEIFNILEESKIHFKVEGKNIIVTP